VAWVTLRKNVLSGFFYLAALLAYLRFDPEAFGRSGTVRRWRWYGAALFCFLCALASKTVACTLPAAVLLVVWWERGRIRTRDVLPLVPFVAAGAAMAVVTAWMERHTVGAHGPEWSFTPTERMLIAGRALWFYAAKLVWPGSLAFNYERWKIDPA